MKKAVLGKYITNIGQESFYGYKQLKTIEIKSTRLKSVGKNAVELLIILVELNPLK